MAEARMKGLAVENNGKNRNDEQRMAGYIFLPMNELRLLLRGEY
jgi:hypothetical protein